MNRNLFLSIICLCVMTLVAPLFAQAQGNNIISRDAIGLRVSPNPEHYSPYDWYNKNIKIKGSPQFLIVDGFEAVRDGRTVYVNGAKIARVNRCAGATTICQSNSDCSGDRCESSSTPELYTNIYIISYNQEPEAATTDIFGQLLQFWKFNPDIKNCSDDPSKLCTDDAECSNLRTGGAVCQPTGYCSKATTKTCLLDQDCGGDGYCQNKKSAIIRDVKRLADLRTTKDRLDALNNIQLSYPTLSEGTYLTYRTISTWPSWQGTLKAALGADLPDDPINILGPCGSGGNYDGRTCWDELAKRYAGAANPLGVPANSYAYYYQYGTVENTFKLCGVSESGFVNGQAVGSPICQKNACASCANRQCGTDGCGTSCGTCAADQICYKYQCRRNNNIQTEQ